MRFAHTPATAAYVLAAVAACAHTAPLWRAMRFAHTPAVAAYVLAAVAACAHTAPFLACYALCAYARCSRLCARRCRGLRAYGVFFGIDTII